MAETYRVQHIGSLIRPKSLIDLSKPLRIYPDWNKDGTPEQMKEIKELTEASIRDVVKEQIDRGVRPITSGEFERVAYVRGLFENLSGIERQLVSVDSDFWRPNQPFSVFLKALGYKEREAMVAVGKIKRGVRSPYLEEWRFLRSCLSENEWRHAKITVLTPMCS